MTDGGLANHLADQAANTVRLLAAQPSALTPIPVVEHYRRAAWVQTGLDEDANTSIRDRANEQALGGVRRRSPLGWPPTLRCLPDALEAAAEQESGRGARSLAGLGVDHPWLPGHPADGDGRSTPTTWRRARGCRPRSYPDDVVREVLGLLGAVAVDRHGQTALVRALARPRAGAGQRVRLRRMTRRRGPGAVRPHAARPGRGRARTVGGAAGRTGEQYDATLLAEGDRRNVVDRYRYWTMAAIVADLDARRHDFHVAIENWKHDFNIGTIVRSANAFLAREVHIVGNRRWNRRGAMVTDRYQHVVHHEDVPALAAYLRDRPGGPVALWGIDNLPGSLHLETTEVPRRVCFLFGQEGPGTVRRRPARRATRRSRSRSSGRPGRSTPRPPPRSRCTPGCAPTPTCPGTDRLAGLRTVGRPGPWTRARPRCRRLGSDHADRHP